MKMQLFIQLILAAYITAFLSAPVAHAATVEKTTADANNRSRVNVGKTDTLRVIEELSTRIRQLPEKPLLYLERGDLYLQIRENGKAITDYTRVLELDDGIDEAYFQRGMALGRNGQFDAAIRDFTVYLQRHPDDSLAYTKRGVRYLWKGEINKAFADYRNALRLDKNNAEASDDIGVIYAQRGEYLKALASFSHAISVDPAYQKAYHNRAMVFFMINKFGEALTDVEYAEQLHRENRNTLLLKSLILEALGRQNEANKAIQRASSLPETGPSESYPVPVE